MLGSPKLHIVKDGQLDTSSDTHPFGFEQLKDNSVLLTAKDWDTLCNILNIQYGREPKDGTSHLAFIQIIGARMHSLMGKENQKYKKCIWNASGGVNPSIDNIGKSTPIFTFTVPSPEKFYKAKASGIYIPSCLKNRVQDKKYAKRYICLLGFSFVKNETPVSVLITHIGTFRVELLLSCLKEYDETCTGDNLEECCIDPWQLDENSEYSWYFIPWEVFPKLLYTLRKSDETKEIAQSPPNFRMDNIRKGYSLSRYNTKKPECDKSSIEKCIVLKNGWNSDTMEPPRSSKEVYWSLSEDLTRASEATRTPLFALDKSPEMNKLFICTSYLNIYKFITGKYKIEGIADRSHVCVHSIVREPYATKAFWDFEYDKPNDGWYIDRDSLQEKLVDSALKLIIACFADVFNITLQVEDFLILESRKETKISFHVILASPGLFFASYGHMRRFMNILECFIVSYLISDKDSELKKAATALLTRLNKKHHQKRPLQLVQFSGRKDGLCYTGCFWDINASIRKLAFFRTPYSTKFDEERYLIPSASLNKFSINDSVFGNLPMDEKYKFFLAGLPTAVYKNPLDDEKELNEIGLTVPYATLRTHVNAMVIDCPLNFHVHFEEEKKPTLATIELGGLVDILSYEIGRVSSKSNSFFSSRYASSGGSWNFRRSDNIKGLSEAIRSIMEMVPRLKNWASAVHYDYCVLFSKKRNRDTGILEKSGINAVMIKVSHSRWCPVRNNFHTKRKGASSVLLMRTTGNVKFSCFSTNCGDIYKARLLQGKRELGDLFILLEGNST